MREPPKRALRSWLACGVCLFGLVLPSLGLGADAATLQLGKAAVFDRQKGNCLACHLIGEGESPGDIGPPLVAMQARFADKAALRAQIYDATAANPNSPMPPFGKHRIVSERELDAIVEYLYTL